VNKEAPLCLKAAASSSLADRRRPRSYLGLSLLALTLLAWFLAACEVDRSILDGAPLQPNTIEGQDNTLAETPVVATRGTSVEALALSPPLPPPTYTPVIPATTNPTTTPAPTAAASNVQTVPSPTPQPYAGLLIADLVRREYGGGALEIIGTLEINDDFTRYLFTYPSDGLTIYGFMNVPNQGSRFPVAIALHGYVDPEQYDTLDYTTRYADRLAKAGYFVLHPNLRGFPPSDQGEDTFRVGLAVDVLNLIAIIREQSQDPSGYLRRADPEDINLWGHSMGGGVALRVITVNNSPYIRAAVLYGAMSGDERRNYEKIREWSDGQVGELELAASPALLKAISPIYHLDRVTAPVSIHHGSADAVVPPEWSDELCQRLTASQHAVECHAYLGMPHTFYGASEDLFMERVVTFFNNR
jgi:dienelactone hydrolase